MHGRARPLRSKPGRISRVTLRKKWLEQSQYSQATMKHSRFKDAALTTQELAAVEEEGKTTAMMFALLQEQHKVQLELIAAANKQAMDGMFECMNALIAGHGKAADKVTATIPNSNTGHTSSTTNGKKKKCANFGKLVFINRKLAASYRPTQASITQDRNCARLPVH